MASLSKRHSGAIADHSGPLEPRSAASCLIRSSAHGGGNIANLLDNLNRFHQASGISANSQGATNRAFDQFTNRGTLRSPQFQQAADALRDTIGGALAPPLSIWLKISQRYQ